MAAAKKDYKEKWRKKHPGQERARREKDNDNRNKRYAATGSQNGAMTCSVSGCNRKAQMSHEGKGISAKCKTHHLASEKSRGTGPFTKGKSSGRKKK